MLMLKIATLLSCLAFLTAVPTPNLLERHSLEQPDEIVKLVHNPLAARRSASQRKLCETCLNSLRCRKYEKCESCNKFCGNSTTTPENLQVEQNATDNLQQSLDNSKSTNKIAKDEGKDVVVGSSNKFDSSEEIIDRVPVVEPSKIKNKSISTNSSRYYTVGEFGPGAKQNLVARLLQLKNKANLEKLIVLAKQKMRTAHPRSQYPVIIDTAKVFQENGDLKQLPSSNPTDLKLAEEIDKELNKALNDKTKLAGDGVLTAEETDKILNKVISNFDKITSKQDPIAISVTTKRSVVKNFKTDGGIIENRFKDDVASEEIPEVQLQDIEQGPPLHIDKKSAEDLDDNVEMTSKSSQMVDPVVGKNWIEDKVDKARSWIEEHVGETPPPHIDRDDSSEDRQVLISEIKDLGKKLDHLEDAFKKTCGQRFISEHNFTASPTNQSVIANDHQEIANDLKPNTETGTEVIAPQPQPFLRSRLLEPEEESKIKTDQHFKNNLDLPNSDDQIVGSQKIPTSQPEPQLQDAEIKSRKEELQPIHQNRQLPTYNAALPGIQHHGAALPGTQHHGAALPGIQHHGAALPGTQHHGAIENSNSNPNEPVEHLPNRQSSEESSSEQNLHGDSHTVVKSNEDEGRDQHVGQQFVTNSPNIPRLNIHPVNHHINKVLEVPKSVLDQSEKVIKKTLAALPIERLENNHNIGHAEADPNHQVVTIKNQAVEGSVDPMKQISNHLGQSTANSNQDEGTLQQATVHENMSSQDVINGSKSDNETVACSKEKEDDSYIPVYGADSYREAEVKDGEEEELKDEVSVNKEREEIINERTNDKEDEEAPRDINDENINVQNDGVNETVSKSSGYSEEPHIPHVHPSQSHQPLHVYPGHGHHQQQQQHHQSNAALFRPSNLKPTHQIIQPHQNFRALPHEQPIVGNVHQPRYNLGRLEPSSSLQRGSVIFNGDGLRLPLHMDRKTDGSIDLSLDLNRIIGGDQTPVNNQELQETRNKRNEPMNHPDSVVGQSPLNIPTFVVDTVFSHLPPINGDLLSQPQQGIETTVNPSKLNIHSVLDHLKIKPIKSTFLQNILEHNQENKQGLHEEINRMETTTGNVQEELETTTAASNVAKFVVDNVFQNIPSNRLENTEGHSKKSKRSIISKFLYPKRNVDENEYRENEHQKLEKLHNNMKKYYEKRSKLEESYKKRNKYDLEEEGDTVGVDLRQRMSLVNNVLSWLRNLAIQDATKHKV